MALFKIHQFIRLFIGRFIYFSAIRSAPELGSSFNIHSLSSWGGGEAIAGLTFQCCGPVTQCYLGQQFLQEGRLPWIISLLDHILSINYMAWR